MEGTPRPEPSGQVRGPNGEGINLDLAQKRIGITARDIIPVLFIALIGVFIYFSIQGNRESLGRIRDGLARVYDQMLHFQQTQQQTIAEIKAQLQAERDDGNAQRQATLEAIKDMGHVQEGKLLAQTDTLLQALDREITTLRQAFSIHEYNTGREPAAKLPLDLPPDQMPRRQEEKR